MTPIGSTSSNIRRAIGFMADPAFSYLGAPSEHSRSIDDCAPRNSSHQRRRRPRGSIRSRRDTPAVDEGALVPDPDGVEFAGLTLLLNRLARDRHQLIDGLARALGGALPDAV